VSAFKHITAKPISLKMHENEAFRQAALAYAKAIIRRAERERRFGKFPYSRLLARERLEVGRLRRLMDILIMQERRP
jgi:hypothetical protein